MPVKREELERRMKAADSMTHYSFALMAALASSMPLELAEKIGSYSVVAAGEVAQF